MEAPAWMQARIVQLWVHRIDFKPDARCGHAARGGISNTLVKAIARAFRWRKMLETGQYTTIKEIAKAEEINPSYVSRVLRLTLLAPLTVETILDGSANAPTLAEAMRVFQVEWRLQRKSRLSE